MVACSSNGVIYALRFDDFTAGEHEILVDAPDAAIIEMTM